MSQHAINHGAEISRTESQKVLRNTYMLLGMTLAFSALTASASMAMNLGHGAGLIMSLAALAIVWLVLPRTANTAMGLPVVFLFTGLLGAALGPMLNRYLAMANGGEIVMQALGGLRTKHQKRLFFPRWLFIRWPNACHRRLYWCNDRSLGIRC